MTRDSGTVPASFAMVIGTGSIAACNLTGLVQELGEVMQHSVVVVLTNQARRFITEDTLRHAGLAQLILRSRVSDIGPLSHRCRS